VDLTYLCGPVYCTVLSEGFDEMIPVLPALFGTTVAPSPICKSITTADTFVRAIRHEEFAKELCLNVAFQN
jgi:hypothetical protein